MYLQNPYLSLTAIIHGFTSINKSSYEHAISTKKMTIVSTEMCHGLFSYGYKFILVQRIMLKLALLL